MSTSNDYTGISTNGGEVFAPPNPMLTHLKLRHLRCFEVATCQLRGGTTVFLGENAQGKTSVLEAVCVAMRLQSPAPPT